MARTRKRLPTKAAVVDIDSTFEEFFRVWANIQGWVVPELHLNIIRFLDSFESWDQGIGVLQVFRGAAKSTIVGLFIVYRLVQDPTKSFIVISGNCTLADDMTAAAKTAILLHPLAKHLKGRENTWKADAFNVRGNNNPRMPSVRSLGVDSNLTGMRADFIIYDDVEIPKNIATETLRTLLRRKLTEGTHVLVPGGKKLFVGTPHAEQSIYPDFIDAGASSLKIPLLTNVTGEYPFYTGESAWPDRFTEDVIFQRQKDSFTKQNFLSQYQLIPQKLDASGFSISLVITYKNEAEIHAANNETLLSIGSNRMLSASAFWDPSMGKEDGDDSVLAIVFTDEAGNYYLHRCIKVTGSTDNQCLQIKEAALEFALPQIIIETNGLGNMLPPILRKHLVGTGTAVIGKATNKNKGQKIQEAFEVPLAAGLLHVHESVMCTPWPGQLSDFSPKTCGRSKDDFIDSSASAILNEPKRFAKGVGFAGTRANNWASGGEVIEMEHEVYQFGGYD